MKKILALLIALAMILALAACGGGTKAPASTTPAETTAAEGANLEDPWYTAPKGTVARRVIAHHESSSEFFGEKYEEVYDEVVAYDADDHQLYTRWIDADGQKSENTFEYDADGNRTLWIGRSEEQGEYYRCVYENENGLCVKSVETDSEGEETVTLYEYNGKGWCIKETVTGGYFPGVTEREYNENGDVIYEVSNSDDGSEIIYRYEYNGDNLLKQIRDASYADGTSHHEETVWEYDENGQCTGTTETAPDGVLTTEFEFDENGNETKMVYNGYDSFVVTMEYDADGNMTYSRQEYTDGSSVSEEYFEYDSEGRVIKDSETTKSGDSESSFTITYRYE